MTTMNSKKTTAASLTSEKSSIKLRKEAIDRLSNAARERLSSQPSEAEVRKSPGAILELPSEMNPVIRFLNHRDARSRTLTNYRGKIRRTREFLIQGGFPAEFAITPIEKFPWHLVDVANARSFAQLIDIHFSNVKSRHNILGILRELLRECAIVDLISVTERDRLLDCLPVRGDYFRGAGHELTDEEIAKLLAAGLHPKEWFDLRGRAIIAVFLSTGLRVSEVAELEIGDLNLDADVRSVRVGRTKQGRSLTVWLSPSTIAIVNDWLAARGEHTGALFEAQGHPGIPLCTNTIRVVVKERAVLAHIKRNFTCHDFRRTLATRALRQNVDVFAVQRLLGHKNVQTTLIYDRRSELEDRAVVDSLNLPGLSMRLTGGKP